MRQLKLWIWMAAALPVAVSCLNSNKNRNRLSLRLDTSFENLEIEYDRTDSTAFPSFFAPDNAPIGYCALLDEENHQFIGGFSLSRGVDPVVASGHAAKTALHCIRHPYYPSEETFAVFSLGTEMPEQHIITSLYNEDCFVAPQWVLLNNTSAFVNAVRFGRTMSDEPLFQSGDWAEVTFTGYLKEAKTGTATLRLADFEHYADSVVTAWTPLDLSPLGKVDRINLTLTSSQPKIFRAVCLDHFNYNLHIEY